VWIFGMRELEEEEEEEEEEVVVVVWVCVPR
jgi:hypothetical protein